MQTVPHIQAEYRPIESLVPYANNARKHSPKQLNKLAANIREHGFLVPVLIDAGGMILAGHGRIEAAKMAGLKEVPTILIDHLTEAQKRAFILADNRLAQDASWDEKKLKIEFDFLSQCEIEFNQTGFETAEIDLILDDEKTKTDPSDLPVLPPPGYVPVTRLGDVWIMGNHRLICGNSLLPETYKKLFGEEKAAMMFTDPPYNTKINGHVKKANGPVNREFVMASGEMSAESFTQFLKDFLRSTTAFLTSGAILYVCMDWRHLYELLTASRGMLEFKQLCVWNKGHGGMGSFYRSQHEMVGVFKYGTEAHINNFGLGEKGRYRTNVWD